MVVQRSCSLRFLTNSNSLVAVRDCSRDTCVSKRRGGNEEMRLGEEGGVQSRVPRGDAAIRQSHEAWLRPLRHSCGTGRKKQTEEEEEEEDQRGDFEAEEISNRNQARRARQ